MSTRQMVCWGLVFFLVGWPQLLLAELEETSVASIELEKEVHFLTPDEVTVVVPPGFYSVEAEKNGLQLTRGLLPDEGGETFLLQAKPGTHEEPVEGPIARSIAVEEDAYYLTLLLPEGQSLEVIGSYSGVRPRGANWWEAVRQKAKNSLVAVQDKYEEVSEWNRLCKKRYTKANDINNCCASQYNSCQRACNNKGKQRASCQRECEALNEGCWIRRDANPNWMVNYCGNTKNQRSARTNSREACCQKMEARCQQSCQSFPQSGRAEVCGRCRTAGKICQTNKPQTNKPQTDKAGRWDPLPRSLSSRFQTVFATIEAEMKRREEIGIWSKNLRSRYACYAEKLKRPDVDDRVIEWDTICQSGLLFGTCEFRGMRPTEAELQKHIKSKDDVESANRKIFPPFILHWRNEIVFWADDGGAEDLKHRWENFEHVSNQIHQTNDKLHRMADQGIIGGAGMHRNLRGIAGWIGDRQKDPKSVLSCK